MRTEARGRRATRRALAALFAAVVASGILAPAALRAQAADVRAGDRVRLDVPTIGRLHLTGVVTRTTIDTLVLEEDRTRQTWTIALERVTRLDVSLGSTPRGELVKQSVLAGGAVGAVIGGVATLGDDGGCVEIPEQRRCDDEANEVMGGIALGTLVGATVGAIVGLLRPSERWARVDPPIRLGVARAEGGEWRLGMRVRFDL